jgi:hypothetical protein
VNWPRSSMRQGAKSKHLEHAPARSMSGVSRLRRGQMIANCGERAGCNVAYAIAG